jgi:hypothetical protein
MPASDSTALDRSSATSPAVACGLVFTSLLVGLAIVETICRFFTPLGVSTDQWDQLASFFQGGGAVFENHGPIFTYVPHKDIRNLTVHFTDRGFATEYDYRFHTNNFGLVQDSDIEPARPSLLLLGDSFTEGMGAAPWFRKLVVQDDKPRYQMINGGLRGTGFAQWELLDRYLAAAKVDVEKLLVLFITADYVRSVSNASPEALHCLASDSLSECPSDNLHSYFPMPSAEALPLWVDEIKSWRARDPMAARRRFSRMMPATHFLYMALTTNFSPAYRAAEDDSRGAIARLIAEHGVANVAFMHLPQKDEIDRPSALGLRIRQDITAAGGRLYDGFTSCGLTAGDYHVRDSHPNEAGYDKIAHCVGDVIRDMTAKGEQAAAAERDVASGRH